MNIYTIGHSRHTWDVFFPLLQLHDVKTVVDIRSNPVSRFAPFANKKRLPVLLDQIDVRYLFMGDSIGGKPTDPALLDSDGKPDYGKIRQQPSFREGIADLIALTEQSEGNIVLMCAEEDPTKCHRRLLITPELESHGVDVLNIRKTGELQTSNQLTDNKAYRKQIQGAMDLE